MNIIDLTHVIEPGMPVYPGTEPPVLSAANGYEDSGFRETLLTLASHTGTHMDAPAHLFPDGAALDGFAPSQFVGTGLVVRCTDLAEGDEVPLARVLELGERAERVDFLLFHFGWDRFWGSARYFADYPVLSLELVAHLTRTGIKGIGLDTIGLDPISDGGLARHRLFLEGGKRVIVENLCRLDQVGSEPFTFVSLPLKFQNADGAPTRAVALMDA